MIREGFFTIWGIALRMHALVASLVRHARIWGQLGIVVALAGISGCSLSSLAGNAATSAPSSTGSALRVGQWSIPAFPGIHDGAQGQVIFATSNPLTGYACVNAIPAQLAGTTSAPAQAMIFGTSDGGLDWLKLSAPTGLDCAGSALFADDPTSARDVFLLASTIAPGQLVTTDPAQQKNLSLWRSQDNAQHWTQLALPQPSTLAQGVSLGLNPAHLSLVVTSHRLLLGTSTIGVGAAIFASLNGGTTWTTGTSGPGNGESFLAATPGAHGAMLALATSQPLTLSSLTPLDIWQSTDGQHWAAVGSGIPPYTKLGGVYAGATMTSSPDGIHLAVILPLVPQEGESSSPRVIRSLNGGVTWSNIHVPIDPSSNLSLGLSALILAGSTGAQMTDDGTLWLAPCFRDDLTLGGALDSEGIWAFGAHAKAWVQVAHAPHTGDVDLSYLSITKTLQSRPAIWTAFSGTATPYATIMVFVAGPDDLTPAPAATATP
jgi:hypothetical protein